MFLLNFFLIGELTTYNRLDKVRQTLGKTTLGHVSYALLHYGSI